MCRLDWGGGRHPTEEGGRSLQVRGKWMQVGTGCALGWLLSCSRHVRASSRRQAAQAGPRTAGQMLGALSRGPQASERGPERVLWLGLRRVDQRWPGVGGRKASEDAVVGTRGQAGPKAVAGGVSTRLRGQTPSPTSFRPRGRVTGEGHSLDGHFPAPCPQRASPGLLGSTQQCLAPSPPRHGSAYSLWI